MAVDFAQFAQRLGWSFIIIFFKVAQKNVRPSNGGTMEVYKVQINYMKST